MQHLNSTYGYDHIIDANLIGQRSLISQVLHSSPMFDTTALQIKGRMIRFGDRKWVADFASCNYLGFDLNEEIIESVEPALKKWGIHTSRCSLVDRHNL